MKKDIILASTSPRRKQLLSLLKIKFKVVDSGYEEVLHKHLSHQNLVKFLALGKAQAATKKYPNAIIIAADTLVSLGSKVLGKPKSKKEAERMLKSLSGTTHYIYTGVAILDSKTKQIFTGVEKTKMHFKKLSSSDIGNYIATGEPMDRAGAYALQEKGFNLVSKIEGSFEVAVGLPMELVYNGLKKLGVEI